MRRLAKGHTAADFGRALGLLRQHGLAVHPTFIPFHPWTTPRDYGAFLERIADYDLIASVNLPSASWCRPGRSSSSYQRWPPCSARLTPGDSSSRGGIPTPRSTPSTPTVLEAVTAGECEGRSRAEIFVAVWHLAGLGSRHDWADAAEASGGVPHLLEPWFCCAEPPAMRLGCPGGRADLTGILRL